MPGTIYLLQDNGTLHPLEERPYDNEDLLQGLLGSYPDLLAGDQIDELTPRRWLLVSREMGVPLEESGADLMSLDHLFLDQDAIPTLVEVKRSSDTRIRREVVGQMLDYAANAVAYCSADGLRTRFETSCEQQNQDPDLLVSELLEDDSEDHEAIDAFWGQVKTNLQSGKIRLVFVADQIPRELRRIVEFLNRFTDPEEVQAVEVHQYIGSGLKTLVPRVIGQSEEAKGWKASSARRPNLNREEFFRQCPAEVHTFFEKVLAAASERGDTINWGPTRFSVRALLLNGKLATYAYCSPTGKLELYFGQGPFSEEQEQEVRAELLAMDLFEKAGERTQRALLNRENIALAATAHDLLLERLEEFSEAT